MKRRFAEEQYIGRAVAITLCIDKRRPTFTSAAVVDPHLEMLRTRCEKAGCRLSLFCYMPEHVHLIIGGLIEGNPLKAIYSYKAQSGGWFRRNLPLIRWQSSFHDHIIRNARDFEEQVYYIIANPVRAGLCDDPYAYPFSGSDIMPLDQLVVEVGY